MEKRPSQATNNDEQALRLDDVANKQREKRVNFSRQICWIDLSGMLPLQQCLEDAYRKEGASHQWIQQQEA